MSQEGYGGRRIEGRRGMAAGEERALEAKFTRWWELGEIDKKICNIS